MARVIPRDPDATTSDGTGISFTKDEETGLFRKVETVVNYNLIDYSSKKKEVIKSDNLYKLSSESDWDYKFELTDPRGKPQTIYFKEV